MKNYDYEEIKVGMTESFPVAITSQLVQQFIALSGDTNPLHSNEEYARKTEFRRTIVHGMAVASFFSRLIGLYLPGRKALYLSQTIDWKKPVIIGDTLTIKGTVLKKTIDRTIVVQTLALRGEEIVASGKAIVRIL